MSKSMTQALQDLRDRYVNQRVGPYYAWNKVSRTQIWQWCAAMGDDNPLYLGGEAAVAPPTMLQSWTFRNVKGKYAPGSTDKNTYEILGKLDQLGYNGSVAVSYDQRYHHYFQEGDHVYSHSTISNITDLKQTGLGEGCFVSEHAEYFNQDDIPCGEANITYLKYKPPEQAPGDKPKQPKKIERIRPVENHDSKHYWQGLRDGKLLLQQCSDCQSLRHPPQPMCEQCQSLNWNTLESECTGTVHSFTSLHYPEIPPFDYPNTIVLVDLDEGVRIASQFNGQQVSIGQRVKADIVEVQEGLSLPIFAAIEDAKTQNEHQTESSNDETALSERKAESKTPTLNIEKAAQGTQLPTLEIPITAVQIVSGAIASQDFENVHHDKAAAIAAGTPDIFMNILTTNGLVGRYLTDWAGADCRIERIQLKLGAPNFPGDNMTLSGSISDIQELEQSKRLEIEFKGKNQLGNHVTGTATLIIDKKTRLA